jgi:hypothetical protein
MAGSYNHVVTDQGNLVSNERFVQMVENLGDAFETVEEMYGMIWLLASLTTGGSIPEHVKWAQENYKIGLTIAKQANREEPSGS